MFSLTLLFGTWLLYILQLLPRVAFENVSEGGHHASMHVQPHVAVCTWPLYILQL
jgi:hypothetical protein